MIAMIGLITLGCFSNYDRGVDPDGDGVPWPVVGVLEKANVNPEGEGSFVVALGDMIYFAPVTADPNAEFMRSFNVTTTEFGGPYSLPLFGFDVDFNFVAGGEYLYLLGENTGRRYDPTTDSWYSLPASWASTYKLRKAAPAYHHLTDAIVLVGGDSDDSQSVLIFDLLSETLISDDKLLPIAMNGGRATITADDSIMYAAGGYSGDGVRIVSRDLGGRRTDGTEENYDWTRLADAPDHLGLGLGMGTFGNRIWFATDEGRQMIYDPEDDAWSRGKDKLPDGTVGVVNVEGEVYAVVADGTTTQIWKLSID